MLIFGFGLIIVTLGAFGLAIYIFSFAFLFYCWPILIGIFVGLFKSYKDVYETELDEKSGAKIHRIVENICKRTGQRRPHKIVIKEGSELAVSGFLKKKIIIGMVSLKFMNEYELETILAHEYGHFANKDTVLGYLTYRIQHFIEVQKEISRQNMGLNIFIVFYFPTWLLFWLFSKYYSLISLWYSRRVEFRADAFAADLVGKQRYADTLVKYCIVSDIFEDVVPKYVLHYLNQGRAIVNLYDYIKPIYTEKNIKLAINNILSHKSSWQSTHPSISERLEMVGVKKVDLDINMNTKPLLANQEFYERESSRSTTDKIAYWVALSSQEQNKEQN
jgi:Zn-dependent protease with chaperone function